MRHMASPHTTPMHPPPVAPWHELPSRHLMPNIHHRIAWVTEIELNQTCVGRGNPKVLPIDLPATTGMPKQTMA